MRNTQLVYPRCAIAHRHRPHTSTNETIAILGAKELIALDQGPLGFQGRVIFDSNPGANATSATARVHVYGKKLQNGSVGVVLLNRGDATADISLQF